MPARLPKPYLTPDLQPNAIAIGIAFVGRMVMWGAMFGGMGGSRDDDRGGNPLGLLILAIPHADGGDAPPDGVESQCEFEADRAGARLIGDGESLARALEKLELGARRIPMDVNPAQAQAYIVNPLTGRNVQFANLFRTHPATQDRVSRLRSLEWAGDSFVR